MNDNEVHTGRPGDQLRGSIPCTKVVKDLVALFLRITCGIIKQSKLGRLEYDLNQERTWTGRRL